MNYFKKNYFTLAFISLSLAACQGMRDAKGPEEAKAALAEQQKQSQPTNMVVPDSITQDLLSLTSPMQQAQPIQARFNVAAANVDVADFFTSLVADTDYSVAIHPAVTGQITLDLKQVTLSEAFAVIEQLYGYHIQQVGSIYKIMPGGLRTETIPVNYLLMQRSGSSSISVTAGGISSSQGGGGGSGGGSSGNNNQNNNQNNSNQNNNNQNGGNQNSQGGQGNGSSVQSSSQTDFWKDLKEAITGVMGTGPNRAVVVSPQAGLVTVRGLPAEIEAVRAYLGQTEESLQRQVILEVKIIEVTLNDDYQQGINWTQIASTIGTTDINFSNNTFSLGNNITAQVGGLGRIGFEGDDFSGVINLLETQGNAQVLSSPRVTAINNQKAVIKVGSDEYYVTGVNSSSSVTGNDNGGVTNIDVPIPTLEPFFSGIALDVTPQINVDGDVILHVHPSVSETTELSKSISVSGQAPYSLPSAQTNIRESDTIIKARNGEIVVIGGLMQSTVTDSESRVPVLGAVPLVGKLFTNISKVSRKKELIILIKPTVSSGSAMQQQLKQSADVINQWYPKN